ncbi:uncharacterized protein N7458_007441 [Penicillium daleae]|uniref:Uncharacterized protein n=1 Tax=Penicillium daleae TaxID=63821 RepID=A0AAD6C1A2_9EURO|nr:uncharacterized protein N7458_007441 [Penicillium daleae]KAJ5443569.1 hypothetical protein N7458_007441 [Penicillium daleae]
MTDNKNCGRCGNVCQETDEARYTPCQNFAYSSQDAPQAPATNTAHNPPPVTIQKTQVAQSSPSGPPSSVGTAPITLCQWLSQDKILELWKSLTFNPKQSGLQLQLPVRNPPSIHPVHFLRPPRGRAGQHPRDLDPTM